MPASIQPSAIDDNFEFEHHSQEAGPTHQIDIQEFVEHGDNRSAIDDRIAPQGSFIPEQTVNQSRTVARQQHVQPSGAPARTTQADVNVTSNAASPAPMKPEKKTKRRYKGVLIRGKDGETIIKPNPWIMRAEVPFVPATVAISATSAAQSSVQKEPSLDFYRKNIKIVGKDGQAVWYKIPLPLEIEPEHFHDTSLPVSAVKTTTAPTTRSPTTTVEPVSSRSTHPQKASSRGIQPSVKSASGSQALSETSSGQTSKSSSSSRRPSNASSSSSTKATSLNTSQSGTSRIPDAASPSKASSSRKSSGAVSSSATKATSLHSSKSRASCVSDKKSDTKTPSTVISHRSSPASGNTLHDSEAKSASLQASRSRKSDVVDTESNIKAGPIAISNRSSHASGSTTYDSEPRSTSLHASKSRTSRVSDAESDTRAPTTVISNRSSHACGIPSHVSSSQPAQSIASASSSHRSDFNAPVLLPTYVIADPTHYTIYPFTDQPRISTKHVVVTETPSRATSSHSRSTGRGGSLHSRSSQHLEDVKAARTAAWSAGSSYRSLDSARVQTVVSQSDVSSRHDSSSPKTHDSNTTTRYARTHQSQEPGSSRPRTARSSHQTHSIPQTPSSQTPPSTSRHPSRHLHVSSSTISTVDSVSSGPHFALPGEISPHPLSTTDFPFVYPPPPPEPSSRSPPSRLSSSRLPSILPQSHVIRGVVDSTSLTSHEPPTVVVSTTSRGDNRTNPKDDSRTNRMSQPHRTNRMSQTSQTRRTSQRSSESYDDVQPDVHRDLRPTVEDAEPTAAGSTTRGTDYLGPTSVNNEEEAGGERKDGSVEMDAETFRRYLKMREEEYLRDLEEEG